MRAEAQGLVHDEPRNPPAHRRPVFVGRSIVNPRIDTRVDHLLHPLAQPDPVTLEAGIRRTDDDNRRVDPITEEPPQETVAIALLLVACPDR